MLSRIVIMLLILIFSLVNGPWAAASPPGIFAAKLVNPPVLFLRTPTDKAVWEAGTEQLIIWTCMDYPGPTVKIILLKDGKPVQTIATRVLIVQENYKWKIPEDLAPGNDYQVSIISERTISCKNSSYKFEITAKEQ